MKSRILFRLALAASLTLAIALADQVTLKNGDRVTGSIVKKDAKSLIIKSDAFGVISVAWEQVDSIKADTPLNVGLPQGKTVVGTLATSDGKIEVAAKDTKQTVAPADIVTLRDAAEQKAYERLLAPRWRDLWIVTGGLNLAGTKGNAESLTLTTPVNASRVTNTDKTTVYFNLIRASATVNGVSAATAEAVRGGWAYNRNLRPRLFVTAFNDWEYDKFQNLDLRAVFGGGLGYSVWKGEKGRLDLVGGLDYDHDKFGPPSPALPFSRNSAEAFWGDDFAYKMSARTSLTQSYRMFNNLSNTGNYRQNFDIGATTALTKWLNWNIALSDRFLSDPVVGRKKNDFLYTTGLGFTFAR